MPDFRVFETDEFLKQLGKLTPRDAVFLRRKLDDYVYPQIKREPFGGKNIRKLKDYSPNTWRYRIGRFRLFYIIDQRKRVVFFLTIDSRKDAYR